MSDRLTDPKAPAFNLKRLVIRDSKIDRTALIALINIYRPTDEVDLSDSPLNEPTTKPQRSIMLGNIRVKELNVSGTKLNAAWIIWFARALRVSEKLYFSEVSPTVLALANECDLVDLTKLCAWARCF